MTLARAWRWGLIAVVGALALALPYLTTSFYVGLATQVLFYGLLAMSIDLLGGYGGLMPLGHAGIWGVGAYGLGYFLTREQLPPLAAVALALALTVAVAAIFGVMSVRSTGIFFTMITLAQGMLVWGGAYRWYQVTGAENGLRGITRPLFASRYYEFYYLVLAVVAVCAIALWVIVHSPFGLALQGIRESESRMRTLGYDVARHRWVAFVISGVFAGVAGILFAWYNGFISPASVGLAPSAEGVLMVILGGAGTLLGPVLGAAVIVVAKNILSLYTTRWPTIMGAIFVVTILFARDGIVGAARRLAAARAGRPPHVARGAPAKTRDPI